MITKLKNMILLNIGPTTLNIIIQFQNQIYDFIDFWSYISNANFRIVQVSNLQNVARSRVSIVYRIW